MKLIYLLAAAVVFPATIATAFDLSKVETKEILGFVGPSKGAKIKPTVIAKQALEKEGIASLAGRNLRTRFCCLLYTSPSPRDQRGSRMPSSA